MRALYVFVIFGIAFLPQHSSAQSETMAPRLQLRATCDDGYHPEVSSTGLVVCVPNEKMTSTPSMEVRATCDDGYHPEVSSTGLVVCVKN